MKLNLKIVTTLLLAAVFAAACGAGAEQPAGDTVDMLVTSAVGTMVSSFFETQTALIPPATTTPVSTLTPLPTPTRYPSITPALASPTFIFYTATLSLATPGTPTVTGTLPTATVNPNALAFGCNNLAFIRDVNIPPGTVLEKGGEFTKTWKVQNTGSCNWMFQYRLVLLSGDIDASGDYIQKQVTVWDWAEVSINATAPKHAGTYTSYWRMADGDGRMFGATLTLSFVVAEDPTPTP